METERVLPLHTYVCPDHMTAGRNNWCPYCAAYSRIEVFASERLSDALKRAWAAEAEVERLTAELGNQEAVMVAADRLWTAYQAMLDGEDVGRLPEWEQPVTKGKDAQ